MPIATKSQQDIFRKLEASPLGLTTKAAEDRLKQYGLNTIEEEKKKSPLLQIFSQFKSPLIYILLITAFITYLLGKGVDTWVILGVVIFNAAIGFFQERKAENALAALKKLVSHKAAVLRDGKIEHINASHVVPGDIVYLESGHRVPADIQVFKSQALKADESVLTGESVPVDKNLEEGQNEVLMGTYIVSGKGMGIVVATGPKTEFGKIAEMVAGTKEEETPLQKKIHALSKNLIVLILLACFSIFLVGFFRSMEIVQLFLVAASTAVSAIPEGLPAVITITLAVGMMQMARRKAILRKLVAVETLGSVNLLATDKTGTLTQNQMTVVKMFIGGEIFEIEGRGYEPKGKITGAKKKSDLYLSLIESGLICNDSKLHHGQGKWTIEGDPTEGALVVLGEKAGLKKESIDKIFPRIDELPFDHNERFMATLNEELGEERNVLIAKGAIEKVLEFAKNLTPSQKKEIISKAELFSNEGLRVLAVAKKELPLSHKNIKKEDFVDLNFIGLFAMHDPPRREAKEAIEKCKSAGIRVVMITGDNGKTAEAIAKELKIISDEETSISGEGLSKMTEREFDEAVEKYSVFSRISPEMKFEIVEALQRMDYLVGVTGDGVNDAPALKKASIGVAMGLSGTDVAKEASDLVLMDDNFATIVAAVEEGRTIFQNIRRVVFYLISTGVGEVLTILGTIVLGLPLPLLPVQILWINLVTDGTANIPLAIEPKHEGIMNYPPRPLKEPILGSLAKRRILLVGLFMMVVSISLFYLELKSGASIERARTIIFLVLVVTQIFNVLNCRSMSKSVFRINFWSNKYSLLAMGGAFLLALTTVYIPTMRTLFHTVVISPMDWVKIISLSSLIIIFVELDKFFNKTY